MLPSLNYDSNDPKFILLGKIFKIIDSKNFRNICSRNGIRNRQMMIKSIKILFMGMYFDYPVSKVISELNRSSKLRRFAGFYDEVPTAPQIYEYLSRYSAEQYCKIVNSAMMRVNKETRGKFNEFIIDATPVACDFNTDKKYISKEHLEKLGLKWAYSSTMGYYIGFKVTVVVNKKNMVPVAILIDSGSPNDKKIFEDVLKNLLKRRIIKRKDIIYFDRGYCSYKNYIIGINEFGIVPMIFPQGFFKEEKLRSKISYPLDVFSNNKPNNKLKHDIKFMLELLCEKLKNWKKFKPIRGIIEDFFKVGKCALNLWKFHSYTTESMHRKIYLCILLVVLVTQEGYTTKTKMQRLSEGDVVQDTPINKKSKKKKNKSKNKYKKPAPKKTKQTKLKISRKEPQKTLKQTTII